MISLCNDYALIKQSIERINKCDCLKEIITLYLDSYGAEYDFNQFYIQLDGNGIPTAVLHRYNSQLHLLCDDADLDELLTFVGGFVDCELITNVDVTYIYPECETCFVMTKVGEIQYTPNPDIRECNDARVISELVCCNESKEMKTDFFLNTAHQLRRNRISVSAYYVNESPVAVLSSTHSDLNSSVLTFVYTDEYFRGNGYMKKLLANICSNPCVTYMLLCEKHNVKFYEKCGFTQHQRLFRFSL